MSIEVVVMELCCRLFSLFFIILLTVFMMLDAVHILPRYWYNSMQLQGNYIICRSI